MDETKGVQDKEDVRQSSTAQSVGCPCVVYTQTRLISNVLDSVIDTFLAPEIRSQCLSTRSFHCNDHVRVLRTEVGRSRLGFEDIFWKTCRGGPSASSNWPAERSSAVSLDYIFKKSPGFLFPACSFVVSQVVNWIIRGQAIRSPNKILVGWGLFACQGRLRRAWSRG